MTRYSGATYRPLGKQGEPAMKTHAIICVHTMVGYLTSTDAMFRKGGYTGTESHYGIGGKWGGDASKGLDGEIYCWQDDAYSADANLDGWHRVISIETADNAPSRVEDIAEWTPRQCESIARVIAFHCRAHNIPPTLIPDTKPGRRGIAYHRQGCLHSDGLGSHPGWLVAGGEKWSSAKGKGCPGPRRITQLRDVVIPRVQEILSPKPAPTPPPPPPKPPQETEMTPEEVRAAVLAVINSPLPLMNYVDSQFADADDKMTLVEMAQHGAGQSRAALKTIGTAVEDLAALKEANVAMREQLTDVGTQLAALTSLVQQLVPTEPA
jgi:hypothetical protein